MPPTITHNVTDWFVWRSHGDIWDCDRDDEHSHTGVGGTTHWYVPPDIVAARARDMDNDNEGATT